MTPQRLIELLSPARDAECACAAIDFGADAVYIGAPCFGARAEACNTLDDIARVIDYAHTFHAKVYVALNTILTDNELPRAERLAWDLYRLQADALIVQDMAFLEMSLPPIPLHASTQADIRTPNKVKFLAQQGFSRVILARELSLDNIRQVHQACNITLEAFVHGALCVSYSGQCYASQHCFKRSANRGACAQFCRLNFNLSDATGRILIRNKYLLSLKDLNRSDQLEPLLDAGVSSLKIEGRLKDITYVKNVTALYRSKLDELFTRRKDLCPASSGHTSFSFTPQADKSFNRGFTSYLLNGSQADISAINSPKSIGEPIGKVKTVQRNFIILDSHKPIANGDGLCFTNTQGTLQGFRVNRVDGTKIFPHQMPKLKINTLIFRNHDAAFTRLLAREPAERKIAVHWTIDEYASGFVLTLRDADGITVTRAYPCEKRPARTPQYETIQTQLSKLGNTPFTTHSLTNNLTAHYFIPASLLTQWRRTTILLLLSARRIRRPRPLCPHNAHHPNPIEPDNPQTFLKGKDLDYHYNIMNHKAADFYLRHGARSVAPAFELHEPKGAALMTCRHCLRLLLGYCPKHGTQHQPLNEPLYLSLPNGRRFRLAFHCTEPCTMIIYADENT